MKAKFNVIKAGWLLGSLDLKIRYRRSILGPIWITISYLITVIFLSFIWTKVFNQDINNFIWYFAIGLIIWNYIIGIISSSYMLFAESAGILLNYNIEKDVLVARNNVREMHVFFHMLFALLLIAFYAQPKLGLENILLALFGFVLLSVTLFNISYLVSLLVLRYRDLREIFATTLNLLYYVTPILWPIENLKDSEYIYLYNPFYHMVNVIRAPLTNGPFWLLSAFVCASLLIVVFVLKKYTYRKYDNYVALWI